MIYTMITKISELEKYISTSRSKSYQDYFSPTYTKDICDEEAYKLYLWNIQISAAFLEVISLYEVTLRNAIISSLEASFKRYSILNDYFIRALKQSPRDELLRAVNTVAKSLSHEQYELRTGKNNIILPLRIDTMVISPSKVTAELRLVFWENMLSKTHRALWSKNCNRGFTNIPSKDREQIITDIHSITEEIRNLRNRICHHEPIFDEQKINLVEQYSNLKKVLSYINPEVLNIVEDFSRIDSLLQSKPIKEPQEEDEDEEEDEE